MKPGLQRWQHPHAYPPPPETHRASKWGSVLFALTCPWLWWGSRALLRLPARHLPNDGTPAPSSLWEIYQRLQGFLRPFSCGAIFRVVGACSVRWIYRWSTVPPGISQQSRFQDVELQLTVRHLGPTLAAFEEQPVSRLKWGGTALPIGTSLID